MKPVFEINGQDFADHIVAGGIQWARRDVDPHGIVQTLDSYAHRARRDEKWDATITCGILTTAEFHELRAAISPQYVTVTMLCPDEDNPRPRLYYGTTMTAINSFYSEYDDETYWDGATFTLYEK